MRAPASSKLNCLLPQQILPFADPTPQPPAKSGKIIRLPAPERVIDGMDAANAASRLIAATFPGRSENEVCITAALALGVAEQTVRRILRCETKDASWRVMARCMIFLAAQGKDPLVVIGNAALTEIMQAVQGRKE